MIGAILRVTNTLTCHVNAQDKLHIRANPLCYIATLTTGKVNKGLVSATQSAIKQNLLLHPPVVEMTQTLYHPRVFLGSLPLIIHARSIA